MRKMVLTLLEKSQRGALRNNINLQLKRKEPESQQKGPFRKSPGEEKVFQLYWHLRILRDKAGTQGYQVLGLHVPVKFDYFYLFGVTPPIQPRNRRMQFPGTACSICIVLRLWKSESHV
jgi:hypothetical protein